ncbi:hypothetical protein CTEN210_06385 [Chaetoceros tenuissimus]|uniref:GPI inositol-deacylase n=1 Tax=Chaetoceros tenuissimus TaxID=426638 RepID=A0AAD3H4R6_9STRA|nr:hypothetical protein CTEN210_06385 [Chaetoceros tenuissimus]
MSGHCPARAARILFLFAAISFKSIQAFISSSELNQRPINDIYESSSNLSSSTSSSSSLNDIKAAVIVPGFLTGADEMQPLVDALQKRGIPSIAVPFPNHHWIPCLGGRSARPILERIDYTVRHLAYHNGDVTKVPKEIKYSWIDCALDFNDNPGGVLEVGGSSEVDLFPQNVSPRGEFLSESIPDRKDAKGRIALIGHSAGGWISRVYLSNRNYGGRSYNGSELVHSLVTLGSPNANAPGAAFKSIEWINREEIPDNVRALAVAGKGFQGDKCGTFTKNAYSFCCSEGSDGSQYDGDGVTPVFSALAMEGKNCDKLVLEGDILHFSFADTFGGDLFTGDLARMQRERDLSWYASDEAMDQWVGWL